MRRCSLLTCPLGASCSVLIGILIEIPEYICMSELGLGSDSLITTHINKLAMFLLADSSYFYQSGN